MSSYQQIHCCECQLSFDTQEKYDKHLFVIPHGKKCKSCSSYVHKDKFHCCICEKNYDEDPHCCDCKTSYPSKNHCCHCKIHIPKGVQHMKCCHLSTKEDEQHCCACKMITKIGVHHCCTCQVYFSSEKMKKRHKCPSKMNNIVVHVK